MLADKLISTLSGGEFEITTDIRFDSFQIEATRMLLRLFFLKSKVLRFSIAFQSVPFECDAVCDAKSTSCGATVAAAAPALYI